MPGSMPPSGAPCTHDSPIPASKAAGGGAQWLQITNQSRHPAARSWGATSGPCWVQWCLSFREEWEPLPPHAQGR